MKYTFYQKLQPVQKYLFLLALININSNMLPEWEYIHKRKFQDLRTRYHLSNENKNMIKQEFEQTLESCKKSHVFNIRFFCQQQEKLIRAFFNNPLLEEEVIYYNIIEKFKALQKEYHTATNEQSKEKIEQMFKETLIAAQNHTSPAIRDTFLEMHDHYISTFYNSKTRE